MKEGSDKSVSAWEKAKILSVIGADQTAGFVHGFLCVEILGKMGV